MGTPVNADVISCRTVEYPPGTAPGIGLPLCGPSRWSTNDFAKEQLALMVRGVVQMHPNGNYRPMNGAGRWSTPPVHAWAAWRGLQYREDAARSWCPGFSSNASFTNFAELTWWVNRNDTRRQKRLPGGFLGSGEHRVFDRSALCPPAGISSNPRRWHVSDGVYCLNHLPSALELRRRSILLGRVGQHVSGHFLYNRECHYYHLGNDGVGMWDA